ncbi:MAG TPA: patatin-like phospholipase family protein [Pyrinomonadaceae bacterium]|nr:patatin-like phospholipase family protein [Pyrinomonadaceae bacterium]
MFKRKPPGPPPIELGQVLLEELRSVRPDEKIKDPKTLGELFGEMYKQDLVALCFSGGGIRSATFGLGIVQAFAKHGLLEKFDYLSTVSGGGYLGSWLSAWIHRESEEPSQSDDTSVRPRDLGIYRVQKQINCDPLNFSSPNPEAPELRHLREYSNYMSPQTGLLSADSWALGAIYLRNFFLNLTIFIPLLAALLFLPRFLFRVLQPPAKIELGTTLAVVLLAIAMATGAIAIAFVVSRLPSRREKKTRAEKAANKSASTEATKRAKPFLNTDGGVLLFGVVPLLTSAFISATLWAWNHRINHELSNQLGLGSELGISFFLLAAGGAWVFGIVVYLILNGMGGSNKWTDVVWGTLSSALTAFMGGLLLWLVSQKIFKVETMSSLGSWLPGFEWQLYLALSVPLFLSIVLVSATVFVGLASRMMTDEDREWLARYGGWVMIAGSGWIVLNALVLIAPSLLSMAFRGVDVTNEGWWSAVTPTIVSVAGAISAIVSLGGGFSEKSQAQPESVNTKKSKLLSLAPRVAAVVFLGFILTGLAALGTLLTWAFGLSNSWGHIHVLNNVDYSGLAIVFALLAGAGLGMACFVNVNKFSLHSAYRDRLVRAYLGASNSRRDQTSFTGFDDEDNLQLHELSDQRPLHIINASVNLVAGANLAWQNRKAASFTMSPLHCGSTAVGGYRPSQEYCVSRSSDKALRLGTAMAISGAAANPNMGYYSSPVVTFLMSLFNIRLGWWLGNTGKRGSDRDWFGRGKQYFYQKVSPSIAVLPLVNETFGQTNENKRFLMVTDGGHFENLALYEMVLRRCKVIVLSDGAADADFKFGEIANAIQKCKVDLGVDIKFVGAINIYGRYSKDVGEVKRSRFAIAQIIYPEKDAIGWLLYTRPTFYGDESNDIRYYADANKNFPHQTTGDQMYDEKQFEAYRGLGYMTMQTIIGDQEPADLEELITLLREKMDVSDTSDPG